MAKRTTTTRASAAPAGRGASRTAATEVTVGKPAASKAAGAPKGVARGRTPRPLPKAAPSKAPAKAAASKQAAARRAAPKVSKPKTSEPKTSKPGAPKVARPATARPKQADLANKHELYERAVQAPKIDCGFFRSTYKALRGRDPQVLREDFCGTGNLCATWLRGGRDRRAVGVDLDGPTIEWGKARHFRGTIAERMQFVQGDVCDVHDTKADVTAALNFSFCVFKTREEMLRYFQATRRGLAAGGILVLEMYGGHEAVQEISEEREIGDGEYTYCWEQEWFNPIDHTTRCHISFRFPDKSRIDRAFTYDWRVWTLPELRELLLEAGFRHVRFYWEDMIDDPDDPDEYVSSGRFVEITKVENQDSWLAYVVAEK
jgi:SAM-dependent methyltransferase